MRLKERIAIVTGGSRGIGRGIALMFAREGAKVAIAARTEGRLEQVKREIEERGGEALAVPADVGREADVKRLVDATVERFGVLDTNLRLTAQGYVRILNRPGIVWTGAFTVGVGATWIRRGWGGEGCVSRSHLPR